VIADDLVIESFTPPVAARGPLSDKQLEELSALNGILACGDGVLRIARLGPSGVGRALVFLRISEAVERAVLGPSGPELAPWLRGARSALLTDLIVVEGFRRRGVGRRLVDDACRLARASGLARLTLEVRRDNVAASLLYESLGFVRSGDGDVVVYSLPV
jgi:ribosomal protein S18 acetylase RimI-like enzyme